MEEIRVEEVRRENVEELAWFCIFPDWRENPAFIKGVEEKRKWAEEVLQKRGKFAKFAFIGTSPVGHIHYHPIPEEKVVFIDCIYVPEEKHWRKGIARKLLTHLMKEMKKPQVWFDGQPASALVTRTFPGERQSQYPARLFFSDMGFKPVGEDPDFLFYPLEEGFIYQPTPEKAAEYIPQEEDKEKAVIIYGPSFCPFSYVFLKKAEEVIKEVVPDIPVRWISKTEEPEEVKKRGDFEGCIVNAKPIQAFVLDTENFQKEVTEALRSEDVLSEM